MEGKIDLGKKELFEFLKNQRLMTIASAEECYFKQNMV